MTTNTEPCITSINMLDPATDMTLANHNLRDDTCIKCGVTFKNMGKFLEQVQSESKQFADFLTSSTVIAAAVEGSMEKRQAVLDGEGDATA